MCATEHFIVTQAHLWIQLRHAFSTIGMAMQQLAAHAHQQGAMLCHLKFMESQKIIQSTASGMNEHRYLLNGKE